LVVLLSASGAFTGSCAASAAQRGIKNDSASENRSSGLSIDHSLDRRCLLPADRGACKGNFEAYHHIAGEQVCRPFFWGGCGLAPFETKEECENACVRP
jgi:hypothetical protein